MSAADDLARRLSRATPPPPVEDGDFGAVADYPDGARAPTPAAVLFALIDRARPTVLLTRRNAALRQHAGQTALPGGRIDPGEDARAAAVREAWEEVALPPPQVTVHGLGDPYRTGTNFHVTPVIATVPPDLPLVASEAEVDAVFELPADALLDPGCYRQEHAVWQGRERRYWTFVGGGEHVVWGATAGILLGLARRLA